MKDDNLWVWGMPVLSGLVTFLLVILVRVEETRLAPLLRIRQTFFTAIGVGIVVAGAYHVAKILISKGLIESTRTLSDRELDGQSLLNSDKISEQQVSGRTDQPDDQIVINQPEPGKDTDESGSSSQIGVESALEESGELDKIVNQGEIEEADAKKLAGLISSALTDK